MSAAPGSPGVPLGEEASPRAAPPPGSMGFFDHLAELRTRLLWAAVAVLAAVFACYPWSQELMLYLEQPLRRFLPAGETLAFTRLTEPFMVRLKVSALAGLLVASPFMALQAWLFVAPGLYRNEKRYVLPFVAAATSCFLGGALFAFHVLFVSICRFFLGLGQDYRMVVTLDDYYSLLFWTVVGVALTFELPVAIGFLARLGMLSPATLLRRFDVAFILCLVASAFITPTPDAVNMMFVAVPLIGLYLISIGVAYLVAPREARPAP